MKRLSIFLTLIISLVAGASATTKVYRLNLDDEIGSTTWRYTKQAITTAREEGSPLLLVHLNTYGGSVVHADSIRTALLHYPGKVVAFVDNNAASAGALIALACDSVFMRPDASMGAATVVSGNDGTEMPDKYQSYMRAMMRATAESHGRDSAGNWRRDPRVAEAMVDSRISVPGLIDSTKVLTFTPDEALRWGYAEGKAESVDDLLSQLGIQHYSITEYTPTFTDNLLGFLTNPGFQAILIMIIIGGIYFELQTPGMGFPTVAAITAALLYFLPLMLGGIISSWVVILFMIGVVLLLLEIFVVPGFGVTGILGITAMAVALFVGLLENFSITPTTQEFSFQALWKALLTLFGAITLAVVAIIYLTSGKGPAFIRNRSQLTRTQRIEDGYLGVDPELKKMVGSEGITLTVMRPSGKILIDGHTFDAVAEHGFIDENCPVKVTRCENAQLYVLPTTSMK